MTSPILDEIERFLALTGMKPTPFSLRVTGGKDRHLVRAARNGRQLRPAMQEKARRFMTDYAMNVARDSRA
ncbi:hypothetical protein [Sphingopyxis macrogoltabida]|uniref:Uncharacterized protein n=1 Tax=Sphingopyxis macrogoltabida TaxID=33050 RepID=A0AAC8Z1Y4_SPHMC|nr:hypothetical protein [Sphingopyxis macrogoltabida]ALJ14100.1 hypothetical protein LH19_14595 [Sphingopyxis macrogoltabida]AMU90370.1 hypothetical protein ATM17_15190 [Sphingopyxis macrogoltabida]